MPQSVPSLVLMPLTNNHNFLTKCGYCADVGNRIEAELVEWVSWFGVKGSLIEIPSMVPVVPLNVLP
jgi:hypothetical protein